MGARVVTGVLDGLVAVVTGGASGIGAAIAERLHAYREAGLRHVILDCVAEAEERPEQLQRFAEEVRPLL